MSYPDYSTFLIQPMHLTGRIVSGLGRFARKNSPPIR